MVDEERLERKLIELADRIEVSARRLLLDTGSVRATVPMLRGVWGRALRSCDRRAYERIFVGHRTTAARGVERTPLYVTRPAPADPTTSPALDWIAIGEAREFEDSLVHAWKLASDFGLGARREPFRIRAIQRLGPCENDGSRSHPYWPLSEACLLRESPQATTRYELRFTAPLRILRKGKLVRQPTFVDITQAAIRRLLLLAGEVMLSDAPLARSVRTVAAAIPAEPWQGDDTAFVRWSASQQRELTLRGVTGCIHLPEGPGCLQPLVDAAQWIHIGKGAPFGLGQVNVNDDLCRKK